MVQRLVYRTRCTYNTPSNKQRIVKTPANRLVYQRISKAGKKVRCADCKKGLNGVPALRSHDYRRINKCERSVSRAYGGNRCHKCVRNKILRAFLFEEKRCVQAVLLEKKKQKKVEVSGKGAGAKSSAAKKAAASSKKTKSK